MNVHNAKVRNLATKNSSFIFCSFSESDFFIFGFCFIFIKEPEGLDEFARELNAHFDEVESFEIMVE